LTWPTLVVSSILVYGLELGRLQSSFHGGRIPIGVLMCAGSLATAVGNPDWVRRRTQLRLTLRAIVVGATFAVIAVWTAAWLSAPNAARGLRSDGGGPAAAAVFLDINPEPFCVDGPGLPPTAPRGRPVLFLGGASGRIVLRDVVVHRTLNLPSEGVTLVSANSGRC
jgi:hypothetical protein